MLFIKDEINKIFTPKEENTEIVTNEGENKEVPKVYNIVEDNGNIYVSLEGNKYVLEFYNLGHMYDVNGSPLDIYTLHLIDTENKMYGRYKLDDKKLENVTCIDNFTNNTYQDFIEIVKSYKHYK